MNSSLNTTKPRLLLFEPSASPGGPSRYVQSLLDGIDPAEFKITVLCRHDGPYHPQPGIKLIALQEQDEHLGPPQHPGVAKPKLTSPTLLRSWARRMVPATMRAWAGFRRDALELAQALRRCPCDLLHTNSTGCEESPVAAHWAQIPRVLGTFHVDSTCDIDKQRSGRTHRALEWVSNRCLHQAIAVSEATRRDWMSRTGIPSQRVLTIHNGIDPDVFRRQRSPQQARALLGLPTTGRLMLGAVGRLDVAKGFTYLIEAVARLRQEYPQVLLVLAGQGPLRERLEEQVIMAGLADNVRFLGFCSDVKLIYDALDVFVIPSLSETLGYALLEAMAHELPAVGTTVGGIPEVIQSKETGILVPPRDPVGLAEAIKPLLESADLRKRLGRAARNRVIEHFHQADMVRKTLHVYRQMLADKQTAPRVRA